MCLHLGADPVRGSCARIPCENLVCGSCATCSAANRGHLLEGSTCSAANKAHLLEGSTCSAANRAHLLEGSTCNAANNTWLTTMANKHYNSQGNVHRHLVCRTWFIFLATNSKRMLAPTPMALDMCAAMVLQTS